MHTSLSSSLSTEMDVDISPMNYFSNYFDQDYFERLAMFTNKNYLKKTGKTLNCDWKEMSKFFGITALMWCIDVSQCWFTTVPVLGVSIPFYNVDLVPLLQIILYFLNWANFQANCNWYYFCIFFYFYKTHTLTLAACNILH